MAPLLHADEKPVDFDNFRESSESDMELYSQFSNDSHMQASEGAVLKTTTALTTHQNAQHISNTVIKHLEEKMQNDEKYIDQIKSAHQLLSECVQSEMALNHVIKTNENLFSDLLGFADGGLSREIDRQEQERLSAVEIMHVLNHLVQENCLSSMSTNTACAFENHNPSSSDTISTAPTLVYDETHNCDIASSSAYDIKDEPASPTPTREWKLVACNDVIDLGTPSPISKKHRVDTDDYEQLDLTQELLQTLSEATLEDETSE